MATLKVTEKLLQFGFPGDTKWEKTLEKFTFTETL